MARRYTWGMKLHSGEYVHGDGETLAEAASAAGVTLADIKRSMPVKAHATEAEAEATRKRLDKLKQRD